MYGILIMSLLAMLHSVLQSGDKVPATQQIDYQKSADVAQWVWNEQEANPFFCMSGPYGVHDYDITITQPARRGVWTPMKITFSKDGEEKYSFDGHARTVFGIYDDLVYLAEFSYSSNGCRLKCVDLTTGDEKWNTQLRGIGTVEHSAYANRVNLRVGKDVVVIHGNESMGQYLEFVDTATGKTVGHRVFEDAVVDPRLVAIQGTNEVLRKAILNHDANFLREASALGVDLCRTFPEGDMLLPFAARLKDVEIVQLLVDAGCDVNATWERGPTPLFAAIDQTYDDRSNLAAADCMRVLLEHGADPNIAKWTGATPLVRAVQRGAIEALSLLLNHGAEVNDDVGNSTALTFAVQYGYTDFVRLLLEHGANVNTRNYDDELLTHEAERQGHDEIVRLLREAGARE